MVRDLYTFSKVDKEADVVWFKVIYENTVHSEADITSFFAEKNLDIRFAYLDSSEDPSKGKYVMFTEAKKGRDIKSIADELEQMNVVLDIDWGFSKNRVIQSVEFPLHLLGDRAIIIRAKTFINFLDVLNEHVPQSEGLLTIVGLKNGEGAAKYLREMTDLNDKNFLDLLRELLMAAGWGILDYDIDTVELKGSATITDSFIAGEYRDSDVPVCGYISGFLAGYISESLSRTVQVRETRCKSMGDPFCEHVISPAPKGVKIEHLLRGESY
ncbi:V4R domain-containing protein [Methanolobus sp.]|jgi:predicted hydrocarbon binding protein|uniref:V4R domain-containing protein n=1 Tax=Methanolobus sp. TaxID=1874737 RepID=UPI0025E94E6B|nr:V4R domain-containing protein [Methanolobus sp.]